MPETLIWPGEEITDEHWPGTVVDSGQDYDYKSAVEAGAPPDPVTGHWPDKYKKPNHPTFSDESMYASQGNPGHWTGDVFTPAAVKDKWPGQEVRAQDGKNDPVVASDSQPTSWAEGALNWFGGGPEAEAKAREELKKPLGQSRYDVGERPPGAQTVAKGIDAVTGVFGVPPIMQELVSKTTKEPAPDEPSFLNAGIPTIPQQGGGGKQLAAGLANVPIGFANFLLSPGGIATAQGLGMLPKIGQTLAGLGFTAESIKAFFEAKTPQERITTGVGAALLGAGTAIHAETAGAKSGEQQSVPLDRAPSDQGPSRPEVASPPVTRAEPVNRPKAERCQK